MYPFLNFDHNQENFIEALGLSDHDQEVAIYTIIYEMLVPIVSTMEGDDVDDFNVSRSGAFERALKRTSSPEMLFLVTMSFDTTYQKTRKSLKAFEELLKEKDPDEETDFKDILENMGVKSGSVGKIKAESLEDAMSKLTRMMTIRPIIGMIAMLKRSNFNYDKFIDYTVNNVGMSDLVDDEDKDGPDSSQYPDIDDIIRKALEGNDED